MKKSHSITSTAVLTIVGQSVLLVILCAVTAFVFYSRSVTTVYREMDQSITGMALKAVDEKKLADLFNEAYRIYSDIEDPKALFEENPEAYYARFRDLERSSAYQTIRNQINGMRRSTVSTCIVATILFPEKNAGIYVMDASDFTVLPCGEPFEIDTSGYVNQRGRKFDSWISHSETFGAVRTDGIPCCLNETGDLFCYLLADVPVSQVQAKAVHFTSQLALAAGVFIAITCLLIALFLKKNLINPLTSITRSSREFVRSYGESNEEHKESHLFDSLDAGNITELQDVASSLQTMEQQINRYVFNLQTLSKEQARISTELELAESIQSDMLPNIFPAFPERQEFDIYGLMNPAREVGGDFYDFFLIDNDHLGMVIADVSGKGVPAALFMMMSKILVKNSAQIEMDPKKALENVNNIICQNNKNDMFVTLWLGILTLSTGKIRAVNAGHEFPLLRRGDGQFEIFHDPHSLVLGAYPDVSYREYEIQLHSGDTLFVYTDGLPETMNNNYELFGVDRIAEVLNSDSTSDLEEMFMNLGFSVAEFAQDTPQHDDLTMLAIKYKGPTKEEPLKNEKA